MIYNLAYGTNDNWNSSVIGQLNNIADANSSNGTWTNHPAFEFGNTELTGIWVAKFEASNNGSGKISVLPNVTSWRDINVNDIFDLCRTMDMDNFYGWGQTGTGIDTHMMKNTEWGAVAYLSQSLYGRNGTEIWTNPDKSYTTGRVGLSTEDSLLATVSTYPYYDLRYGINASTTGNIYGIYDMSAGSFEYTAAYVNNGNIALTNYASSLLNAPYKYKDVYEPGSPDIYLYTYPKTSSKKGDAVYETSGGNGASTGWYTDFAYMPYGASPFFVRGGYYGVGKNSGIFNFSYSSGIAHAGSSFRPVVAVSSTL